MKERVERGRERVGERERGEIEGRKTEKEKKKTGRGRGREGERERAGEKRGNEREGM